MTVKDSYEMGRYVTRHYGTQGAKDRMQAACGTWGTVWDAYMLGRARFARTGEY